MIEAGRAFAVFILCTGMAAATEVVRLGGEKLVAALAEGPPCCVVDARASNARALRPLPDAIPYRKGLKIKPTAAVVVIADTDEDAARIGAEVGRDSNAARVIAVKGGLAAWMSATAPVQSTGAPPPAFRFVIPSNTCEQGASLQHFKAAPARP